MLLSLTPETWRKKNFDGYVNEEEGEKEEGDEEEKRSGLYWHPHEDQMCYHDPLDSLDDRMIYPL